MSTRPKNQAALLWTATPPTQRKPERGEVLFEFVCPSNGTAITCELRFHGKSYGWEAQFLEHGELFYSHGGFALREQAAQWAEIERKAMETGGA